MQWEKEGLKNKDICHFRSCTGIIILNPLGYMGLVRPCSLTYFALKITTKPNKQTNKTPTNLDKQFRSWFRENWMLTSKQLSPIVAYIKQNWKKCDHLIWVDKKDHMKDHGTPETIQKQEQRNCFKSYIMKIVKWGMI